ncbi:MAG: putative Ig domain-containing protein [Chloroflexota bacterium]
MPRSFRRSVVVTVLLMLVAFGLGAATPAAAATPDAGTEALPTLSLGQSHACALRSNGAAWCWGSSGDESIPPQATFRVVSASGNLHSCGVITDGTVRCWGDDSDDQSSPPTDRFRDVSAGSRHTCGVRTDGTLACWGDDDDGQSTPPAGQFRLVSAGDAHTCALAVDGSIACWGSDRNDQTEVPPGQYIALSAGFAHTCAIRVDGTAACWGANDSDQIEAPSDQLVSVSAGYNHSCGLTPDGRAVCWGHDAYGESTVPQATFLSLAAGYLSTCGLQPDSSITCWGYETWEDELDQAPGPVGRWAVGSGASDSCAVSNDSQLYCWGANDAGQATPPAGRYVSVGVGPTTSCALADGGAVACWGAPLADTAPAPTDTLLTQVAVGRDHACGVVSNGILDCWGADDAGQAQPPVPGAPVPSRTIDPQTATEDAPFELALPDDTFTDEQELTWSAQLEDGSDLPGWLVFDPTTHTFAGTPADADVGTINVTVIATDTEGLTGQTTFPLTVENTEDAPLTGRQLPEQQLTEDSPWEYQIPEDAFVDDDLDSGDLLSWAVDNGDGTPLPGWIRFDPATRTLSGVPARADIGQSSLLITVTDSAGMQGQTFLSLNVARVNHPPTVAQAIPEQKAIQDQDFTFTFGKDTFDEPDADDALVYDATQKGGDPLPPWLQFARSDRTFRGVPRDADVGTLVITVTATDKAGASASTDFALKVINVNDPPSLVQRLADQSVTQDQPFVLTLSEDAFTDADIDTGDSLTLRAVGPDGGDLPAWLSFDPATRTFSGIPHDADAGKTVITVVATDSVGEEAAGSFTLTVEDVNDPPVVSDPIPDQVAPVTQRFTL